MSTKIRLDTGQILHHGQDWVGLHFRADSRCETNLLLKVCVKVQLTYPNAPPNSLVSPPNWIVALYIKLLKNLGYFIALIMYLSISMQQMLFQLLSIKNALKCFISECSHKDLNFVIIEEFEERRGMKGKRQRMFLDEYYLSMRHL